MGILPGDYNVYKALNLINNQGDLVKDFNHEHSHEGKDDCEKEEAIELKLRKYTVIVLEKMIIGR